MPKPTSPEIDGKIELLRTTVEALAADLNELTAAFGAAGAIPRETRARLHWRTQQVLSLTKVIALDRTAIAGREPAALRESSPRRLGR